MKPKKNGKSKTAAPDPVVKKTVASLEFLPVRFTPAERLNIAEQLARAAQSRQDVEDQKKATDASHKELLEGLNLSIKRFTRQLTSGIEMRNVDCVWMLEDPTRSEKTLVRKDTGEVVRTVPMTDHDYQELLPLPPAATAAPAGDDLVLVPPDSTAPANGSAAAHD